MPRHVDIAISFALRLDLNELDDSDHGNINMKEQ
jgi:hypothetical protein